MKSRLQTSRVPVTVPRLAARVFKEEGVKGFFRGLWIPLFTISFVRESEHDRSILRALRLTSNSGAASFTIYNGTKESLRDRGYLVRDALLDVATAGALGGATAGALISFGSARKFLLISVEVSLIRFIGNSF